MTDHSLRARQHEPSGSRRLSPISASHQPNRLGAETNQVLDRSVEVIQRDRTVVEGQLDVGIAAVGKLEPDDTRGQRSAAFQGALEVPCTAAVDVLPRVNTGRSRRSGRQRFAHAPELYASAEAPSAAALECRVTSGMPMQHSKIRWYTKVASMDDPLGGREVNLPGLVGQRSGAMKRALGSS